MSKILNDLDNLIKNFYIFGIDPSDINLTEIENNTNKPDILQIKLLSKFPPIESENCPTTDPNIIISLCFPNGLSLKTSEKPIEDYEFFHFNLKNFYRISTQDKILYFTCCIFYENIKGYIEIKNIHKKLKDKINDENIYIPKMLCINSFYQFPEQFKTILGKIISYAKSDNINIPIEKIIENIVLGIPSPRKLIFYPEINNNILSETKIDFTLGDLNKVRLYSYKMQMIFSFSLENILEIYKWILLEQPVLFFSEDKEKLTNIFETFINMLFPFQYQGPHCSILPENDSGIIEHEEYFVFGINSKWEINDGDKKINYFEKVNMNLFKTVLICDIDNKKIFPIRQHQKLIVLNNNFPKTDNFNIKLILPSENNIDIFSPGERFKLPQKYGDKLKNKLKDISKKFSNEIKYSEEANKLISESFIYFLASIFKDYNEYLLNAENDIIKINDAFLKENILNINMEKLFNSSQFIKKSIEKNDDPLFFQIFFQTNLFRNFLFRKYQNLEKDKFDILLFDETIVKKKNKREILWAKETKFIDSKNFTTKSVYICENPTEFSEDEINKIKSKKDELVNYFQKYDGNKISYYIFPKLLFDNKFFEISKKTEYKFNEEQLAKIFSESEKNLKELENNNYFKIYEGALVNRYCFDKNQYFIENEMRNNVGYLWLSIFCFTFYYCDEMDKTYRFQELFNNLKKMEIILLPQKKIFDYIFMTLINYGFDSMVVKFYDYLNSININNYDLYTTFCNRMQLNFSERAKIKNNLILKQTYIGNTDISFNYYKDKNEDELEIKRRKTEKDKTKKNPFISKRTFHLTDNKSENITKDEKADINKAKEYVEEIEFGTVKCPFCLEELNFSKLLQSNRSKRRELSCNNCKKLFIPKCQVRIGSFTTSFKILHPYYLYNEIALKLIQKYGTKIDLDLLKDEYSEFYWGCILYFSYCGYSFDMLIKYKK